MRKIPPLLWRGAIITYVCLVDAAKDELEGEQTEDEAIQLEIDFLVHLLLIVILRAIMNWLCPSQVISHKFEVFRIHFPFLGLGSRVHFE